MSEDNLETLVDSNVRIMAHISNINANNGALSKIATELKKEAGNEIKYIFAGVNSPQITHELANNYNILEPSKIQTNYILEKVLSNNEERNAYSGILKIMEMGGVENYLNIEKQKNPNLNLNKAQEEIKELEQSYMKLNIDDKLKNISEGQRKELTTIINENRNKIETLYLSAMEYSIDESVERINEAVKIDPNIKIVVSKEYAAIKDKVENKDAVIVGDYKGAISLGEGDNKFNFQITDYNNNPQIQEYLKMYQQQGIDISLTPAEAKKATQKELQLSKERTRIISGVGEKSLDLLIAKSKLTKTNITEKGELTASADDLGIANIVSKYLKPQSNYGNKTVMVVSGAENKEEDNRAYNNKVLQQQATIAYKENGKLKVNAVNIGNDTSANYNIQKLSKIYNAKMQPKKEGKVIKDDRFTKTETEYQKSA